MRFKLQSKRSTGGLFFILHDYFVIFCRTLHITNLEVKMDEKEKITEYINAIYQNIKTAVQSIEDIMPKVTDSKFQKELASEQDKYLALEKECEVFAKAEKIEGIKDNSWFEKAKLWSSINMSTMTDKTTRHIAELMLLGTFMGFLTCIKDQADHQGVSSELDELLTNLKSLERKNIDALLPFLV